MACDAQWSLWRDVVVRGTGFPVTLLAGLADDGLGASATSCLLALDNAEAQLAQARRQCYGLLQRPDLAGRKSWRRVMRHLQSGRAPEHVTGDAAFDELAARLGHALAARDAARVEWEAHFLRAEQQTAQALQAFAADARLREAVAWQNLALLRTAFDPLLRQGPSGISASAASRNHRLAVARYLQRYAAKNDTVGFFGPVGWAHIDPGSGIGLQHGDGLVSGARVEFEPWAVQSLAARIASDPALRPSMVVHAHPSCRHAHDGTITVLERHLRLPPLEQAVLARCDGQRTVQALVDAVQQDLPGTSAACALAALERLHHGRLVWVGMRIALMGDAMGRLRDAVAQLPVGEASARWCTELDALMADRGAALRAQGDAAAVAEVLARLDRRFTALTGEASTHLAGSSYAGRTLVCLDSRRDMRMCIGETVAQEVAASLRPVLDAAHWFSCQAHAQITEFATGLFTQHARGGRLPLDTLWFHLQRQLDTLHAIVDDVVEQVTERWEALHTCMADGPDAVVRWTAAAAAAFADVAPGWPGARFQGPDLMLAARSVDAIAAGDYLLVLGELHAGDRSLLRQVFIDQHPDAQQLYAALDREQTEPELVSLVRTEALLARTRTAAHARFAYEIEGDSIASNLPPERVVRSGALWVEDTPQGLRIRSVEGTPLDVPLHALLGPQSVALTSNRFALFAPAAHRPRRRIGRLVVGRESWRLPLADLRELHAATAQDRCLALHRLAHHLGWPRRVFYRVPGEPKPLFLDLCSPAYAEIFVRTLRAAVARGEQVLDVVEMLPDPGGCWLPDAEGQRYASEWRMLFVRQGGQWASGAALIP